MNPWIFGGALFFLGGVLLVSDFERAAAKDIAEQLHGDQKKVQVSANFPGILSPVIGEIGTATINASNFETMGLPLYTEAWRSKSGTIETLKINLKDFVLSGLHCQSLTASIPNCRFDFPLAKRSKKMRLSQSGTGSATVVLSLSDIETFVKKKFPELKEVHIRTDYDWVELTGKGQFLILSANYLVKAKLKTDGDRLYLDQATVRLDGKEPDPTSRELLLKTLNPVIDFPKDLDLLDAVKAEKIEIQKDSIVIQGRVKIPNLQVLN